MKDAVAERVLSAADGQRWLYTLRVIEGVESPQSALHCDDVAALRDEIRRERGAAYGWLPHPGARRHRECGATPLRRCCGSTGARAV